MAPVELKNIKVLVTGVTGYLGAHVAQQLLKHGYSVRGTVRNTQDKAKLDKIRQQITEAIQNDNLPELEFVEADLLKENDWPAAVAGCEYVCHVASPFPYGEQIDPEILIKTAVEGTLVVLRAAAADGNVRRVVLTSSLAAIHDVKIIESKVDSDKLYNENDWVDPDKVESYSQSKILAERAALKFIEDLPQENVNKKLELTVICPSYIYGPMLSDSVSTSLIIVKRLIDKTAPLAPKFNVPICDVRDVALAHVKALSGAEHVSKRYLIYTESMWMRDMGRVIQKHFKPLGYFVTTQHAPSFMVRLCSLADRSLLFMVPRLEKEFKLDNQRMINELKVTPTDVEKTILDTCHSLINKGIIKPTRRYKDSLESEP